MGFLDLGGLSWSYQVCGRASALLGSTSSLPRFAGPEVGQAAAASLAVPAGDYLAGLRAALLLCMRGCYFVVQGFANGPFGEPIAKKKEGEGGPT